MKWGCEKAGKVPVISTAPEKISPRSDPATAQPISPEIRPAVVLAEEQGAEGARRECGDDQKQNRPVKG